MNCNASPEPISPRGTLFTSRKPDDLPAFCVKMIEEFGGARRRAT
jgi:hypothetical protein